MRHQGWFTFIVKSLQIWTIPAALIFALSMGSTQGAGAQWTVLAGDGQGTLAVEAFLPSVIRIHPGDTVNFENPSGESHTVTFLSGTQPPPVFVPAPDGSGNLLNNALAVLPSPTGPTYSGSGFFNSGFLFLGDSWSLTFDIVGHFHYVCLLHPGMEGDVVVVPADQPVPTQEQNSNAASITCASRTLLRAWWAQ